LRLIKDKHDHRLIKESSKHWEMKWRTRHGKDQMERTRLKGAELQRRPCMKRSKERERRIGDCRKDRKRGRKE
jgi:hypothetical protein